MKNVLFGSVKVGEFFKEASGSAWYLKVTPSRGEARANGVCSRPKFSLLEEVKISDE